MSTETLRVDTVDEVVDPATERVVGVVPSSGPAEAEAAVPAARAAFDAGPWPRWSTAERADRLVAVADRLAARRDRLVELVVAETGCPVRLAGAVQVDLAVQELRTYLDLARGLRDWERNDLPLGGYVSGPLGGKSAQVHLPDAFADGVDRVVGGGRAVWTGFAGQTCTAMARVLVPKARRAEVVEALAATARDVVVGAPPDPATEMGPVITAAHRERATEIVRDSVAAGAHLAAGGGIPEGATTGFHLEPTVLDLPDPSVGAPPLPPRPGRTTT